MDLFARSGWSSLGPPRGEPLSIVQLIEAGSIDAELAGLLWLLVEGRAPVVVAGQAPRVGKTTTLTALLDFLPSDVRQVVLQGWREEFEWLPEAVELGWPRDESPAPPLSPLSSLAEGLVHPETAYLVVPELSDHLPFYTWGLQARTVVRALSLGYGMGATIHADSLEEVFDELKSPEIGLSDDELSHIGVVLILRAFRSTDAHSIVRRIVAAHYVRPLARDAHGHLQRLGPATLATWDQPRDAFDHFEWGLTSELAARVGQRSGDFEAERQRRSEYLAGLASAGVSGVEEVRAAIAAYRSASFVPPA